MCGITGFCERGRVTSGDALDHMTDSLSHRGPDGGGTFVWELPNYRLGFGHRRLSVIDLSAAGDQPMFSNCKSYCIVFNGEIYNYRELRARLEEEGCKFFSHSDTEVVINLFKKKGIECLQELRGMFAFALVDFLHHQLYLVRDRMGVKPLFYSLQSSSLSFGSEIRAVLRYPESNGSINFDAVADYFQYGYITEARSAYHKIEKLKPGCYLQYNLANGASSIHTYWSIRVAYQFPKLNLDRGELLELLHDTLKEACVYRLVSDVPVGIFQSGGYDSTLVTALLASQTSQPLRTFTVGFDDPELDESDIAREVSLRFGTSHHAFRCSEQEAADQVNRLLDVFDEPFSDPSAIPTMLISQLAGKHVKVILSGDGGDENFIGYQRYEAYWKRVKGVRSLPVKFNGRECTARRLDGFTPAIGNAYRILSGDIRSYIDKASKRISLDQVKQLLRQTGVRDDQHCSTSGSLDEIPLWDFERYLPDEILTKVDRSSMSVGLECREPLLDHKLVELCAQIPFEVKVQNGVLKSLAKDIVHRYVDRSILDKPKRGFVPPLESWLNGWLAEEYADLTSEDFLRQQGIFDPGALTELQKDGRKPYSLARMRWSIFVFQKWYTSWIQGK